MGASKREGVTPTHDWQLLLPLFEWPEQERYEEILPLMLSTFPWPKGPRRPGMLQQALFAYTDAI